MTCDSPWYALVAESWPLATVIVVVALIIGAVRIAQAYFKSYPDRPLRRDNDGAGT